MDVKRGSGSSPNVSRKNLINVSRNENVFSVDITYVIRKTKRAQSASFERTV